MNTLPKRVPRLWCARLGLLPLGSSRQVETAAANWVGEAANRGDCPTGKNAILQSERNGVADARDTMNARPSGPLRNQS
jgi:hypothetical protein